MTFTHALATNNYGPAKFIVDASAANGTHTTIASALTSATSGDTIFIRPGTYTENITLVAGVNLAAYGGDAFTPNVTILGNTTASFNGAVTICGIQLKTNGAACLTFSGANVSTLNLINCTINGNDATAISMNAASFVLNIVTSKCQTASNNLLFAVTTGTIGFKNCDVSAGSGANTIAAGTINMFNSIFAAFSITTATSGSFNAYNCFFSNTAQTIFTFAGTGAAIIMNCELFSTSASCVSIGSGCTATISNTSVSSSNTNAITGAGTLNYGGLTFPSSSSTINTTTRLFIIQSPRVETWTPTVVGSGTAGTATYTIQVGSYTRIGPLVYLTFALAWNTGTGTTNLMIGGLPVNIVATAGLRAVGVLTLGSGLAPPATTCEVYVTAAGDANQTQLFCQTSNLAGNGAVLAYAAAGACNGTIIYVAA